ncbi:MAG: SAF domain-containing protein, partial [Gemmatimonadota bacterium]|nr:SAF domain-containing protein [Gemmatimonadota bacterium]
MRSRRLLIVLALALMSGLAAGWLALTYLSREISPGSSDAPLETGEVVVASRDLPVGHVLQVADVKLVRWPADAVPAGYSTSVEDVLGRGVIQRLAM